MIILRLHLDIVSPLTNDSIRPLVAQLLLQIGIVRELDGGLSVYPTTTKKKEHTTSSWGMRVDQKKMRVDIVYEDRVPSPEILARICASLACIGTISGQSITLPTVMKPVNDFKMTLTPYPSASGGKRSFRVLGF